MPHPYIRRVCVGWVRGCVRAGGAGSAGSFGKVVKATCRATGAEFACKIMPKIKFAMKWDGLAQFKREVKIGQMLRHPNIIEFREFFEDSQYFYIIMELCTGGELINSQQQGTLRLLWVAALVSR